MRITGPRSRTGLAVAAIVFAIDRANKLWFVGHLDLDARGPIAVTPFLDLVMVWNRGISYGLFQQESDWGRLALVAFALAVAAALVLWLARAQNAATAIGLGLVIGGALSNPVDRLLWGAVADFYRLHAFGYSWYVFNIADAAIVAGVGFLLYASFESGHKSAGNPR